MANRFLPVLDDNALARRRFLQGCAALAGVAACSGGTASVDSDAGGGGDDASEGDGSGTGDDASSDGSGSTCPASAKDTGHAPSDFTDGVAVYLASASAFVVRDAMGLYALTAICTHQGCTVRAAGSSGFTCPCHGSRFDIDGAVTQGPAQSPLKHYGLCVAESGNVAIDTSTVVAAGERFSF